MSAADFVSPARVVAAPLAGVRVIEWSDAMPAAFCARVLRDLGAQVLKLEPPGTGDTLRRTGPFAPNAPYGEDAALFAYLNHGKESATLDPSHRQGAALLRRLVESADLLITSNTSRLAELQLDGDTLRHIQPALVTLSVTPWATHAGPDAPFAYTDFTLTHHAGYAFHQARPVHAPDQQAPVACADREVALATGAAAANAALWGLLEAQMNGEGRSIECAELDVIAHLLIEPVADHGRGERSFSRLREELQGTEVAGGLIWLLPCKDGFVMISPREQHQWERWVELLGNPAWSRDEALCGERTARNENWMILQDEMSKWTREHSRADVFERAQAARVACFPVSGARDLLDNAQLNARGFFDRWQCAGGTPLSMPGLPFAMRTTSGAELPRARDVVSPALGSANRAVFEERLGLSPDEVESLRRHGVV
ncbi:CaiB/BaiF CoA-transferase family protein [Caballeronia sp. LZ001]|uniref:CaiB/BaiF CoA-transferase family protein n=1 Tax=Caballeronia sp. LZ001 TaxID=3038553 RepID=UPI00285D7695|nr:CaiB/BaiF CoA-transferase family protein [Caballeronia sp. LZ001]MDR5800021.1 CaiB/BaiF CoA-transferase family protein [Caballeronia sp. LZ001]